VKWPSLNEMETIAKTHDVRELPSEGASRRSDAETETEGEETEEELKNLEEAKDGEIEEEKSMHVENQEDEEAVEEGEEKREIATWDVPLRWTPSVAVGLGNTGNTCYMNSVLQCLFHCSALVAFFCHQWPSTAPPVFFEGNKNRHDFTNNFADLIKRVWFLGTRSDRRKAVTPGLVVRGVIQAVPEFRENGQQDAQEALNYILNNLHEELSIMISAEYHPARDILLRLEEEQQSWDRMHRDRRRQPSVESNSTGASSSNSSNGGAGTKSKRKRRKNKFRMRSRSSENNKENIEDDREIADGEESEEEKGGIELPKQEDGARIRQVEADYAQSIISDTFQTLLVQRITCSRCGYTSLSLEEHFELSLALPTKAYIKTLKKSMPGLDDEGRDRSGSSSSAQSSQSGNGGSSFWGMVKNVKSMIGLEGNSLSLRECLQAYFAPEQLQGDEQYHCEKCKSKQDAEKSHSIAHMPEILCFNFKRFNRSSIAWTLNSSKNQTAVTYPLKELDMSEFFFDKYGSAPPPGLAVPAIQAERYGCIYDLIAVVRHSGGINGGHYVANCKNPVNNFWYEYDDDFVRRIPETSVQSNDAYLLFYKKRHSEISAEKHECLIKAVEEANSRIRVEAKEESPINGEDAEFRYIPQYWTLKFGTMTNPGTCGAFDVTCRHGLLLPHTKNDIHQRIYRVASDTFNEIKRLYGIGQGLRQHEECTICLNERNGMMERRLMEKKEVRALSDREGGRHYILSDSWVKKWVRFIRNSPQKTGRGSYIGVTPPGPVSNDDLLEKDGTPKPNRRASVHFTFVNKDVWNFLLQQYGGGPCLKSSHCDLYNLDEEAQGDGGQVDEQHQQQRKHDEI